MKKIMLINYLRHWPTSRHNLQAQVIKIYQETFGTGKPLVLIHGWAMHSGVWLDFAKLLAKSYKVTCIDLPGHGQSEKLDDFTLESISELLIQSVPDQSSTWMGWSLGATVALNIANQFPEHCRSLILLAGNPHFVRTDRWPGINVQVLNAFADNLSADSQGTLLRFLSLQINGLPDYKELARVLKAAILKYPAPDQSTLLQGLQILKATDLRPALAQLKLPVSVLMGANDYLVPAVVGQKMQQLFPELELNCIEGAGHVPFLSHQDQVLDIISRFMDKQ